VLAPSGERKVRGGGLLDTACDDLEIVTGRFHSEEVA
jgi:hypothetical protein